MSCTLLANTYRRITGTSPPGSTPSLSARTARALQCAVAAS
jgi:hypothetical protein